MSTEQAYRSPHNIWMWVGLGSSCLAGLCILFVHPLAGILLPIAVALTFAYLFWEVTGTLVFSAALFLRPGEIFHPIFYTLKLGKVTAGACLLAWVFHFIFLGKRQWSRDVLSFLMLGLTLVIMFSVFVSTDPGRSQFFFSGVWIKLFLLFFAIVHLTCHPKSLRIYVMTLVGLSTFLALLGVHKGFTASPEQLIEGNRVGIGVFLADPNDFSQMLVVMGFGYTLSALLCAPGCLKKAFCVVVLCVLLGGIGVTRSRGGFLGTAGAGVTLLAPYMSVTGLVVTSGVIGTGGLVYLIRSGRFQSDGLDESAQGRLDAWRAAVRMFRHRPLMGVGYECYVVNYLDYVGDAVDWRPKAVHSSWLKVIAELGLMGSLFFFPLIFIALRRAYRLGKWAQKHFAQPDDWMLRSIFLGLFPGLLGWCISGTFLSNSFHWFLYIQIAIISSATMVQKELQGKHEQADTALKVETVT